MIELRELDCGYQGKTVLRNVTLSFPAGKVLVLLGPNGCGKSTLLRTALGLLPKQGGEVRFDGVEIGTLSPKQIAQKAAYLSQSRNVPSISARRMVLHGRFPHLSYPRRYRQEDHAAVKRALEQADAAELADRPMEQLSGGQRQKVYLAMALAQETETVLMDEPTTYLDVRHQLETMDMARNLARQGRAVVLVLHDLSLALQTADVLAVLDQGTLQMVGTAEEVFSSGVLDDAFGVTVKRVDSEDGWQYYCR